MQSDNQLGRTIYSLGTCRVSTHMVSVVQVQVRVQVKYKYPPYTATTADAMADAEWTPRGPRRDGVMQCPTSNTLCSFNHCAATRLTAVTHHHARSSHVTREPGVHCGRHGRRPMIGPPGEVVSAAALAVISRMKLQLTGARYAVWCDSFDIAGLGGSSASHLARRQTRSFMDWFRRCAAVKVLEVRGEDL